MRRIAACGPALAALLGTGSAAAEPASADLLIQHVRVWDGSGAPVREGVSIRVRGGRIAAIGPDLEADGSPVLDAQGATAIPGLVDAHVHLDVVSGSELRGDPPEERVRLRHQHLRAYLACGITTVLDAATSEAAVAEVRAWLAAGNPGPRWLTLGPPIPAPGGYMSQMFPAFASPADLPRAFAAIERAGAIGIKVPIEKGFGPRAVWPIHTPEMRAAIAKEAGARGLPIYVHASSEEEQAIGLDMGARALVHLNFAGGGPSSEFVERARRQDAAIITTFSIIDAELTRWQPERLADPLVVRVVPEIELATARDPESGAAFARYEISIAVPWVPAFARDFVAGIFISSRRLESAVEGNLRAAKLLHDAGVPVVIGSDAANWDMHPYHFHGTTTLRELELLARAGLSPEEVLLAATRAGARLLGLEAEIGTLEVGKRADLVLVEGDPLRDVRALRSLRYVIQNGVARTPDGWMRE